MTPHHQEYYQHTRIQRRKYCHSRTIRSSSHRFDRHLYRSGHSDGIPPDALTAGTEIENIQTHTHTHTDKYRMDPIHGPGWLRGKCNISLVTCPYMNSRMTGIPNERLHVKSTLGTRPSGLALKNALRVVMLLFILNWDAAG